MINKKVNLFEDIKKLNDLYGDNVDYKTTRRVLNRQHTIIATRWEQQVDVTFESHFHEWLEIVLVIEGKQRLILEDQEYILTAGDFMIIDYNKVHAVYCDEPTKKLSMQFKMGAIEQLIPEFDSSCLFCSTLQIKTPYDKTSYEYIITYYLYMFNAFLKSAPELKPEFLGWFYLFFDFIMKNCEIHDYQKRNTKDWTYVNHILSYINRHYHEAVTLNVLSDVLHLSPQYISKIIKEETGKTFKDYLINLRLEYAHEMIKTTNKSLLEISEDCGFPNIQSFINHFKNKYHILPSKYRQEIKKS